MSLAIFQTPFPLLSKIWVLQKATNLKSKFEEASWKNINWDLLINYYRVVDSQIWSFREIEKFQFCEPLFSN